MATRTLNIVISGDSRDFTRTTKSVDRDLTSLEKSGRKSLASLSTGFKLAGAAAVAGFALGVKKSADAAIEAEKANARLRSQLTALGISYSDHEKQIQRVIDSHSQLSGFDDEDLGDSFTNIVRVVGNVNKALKLNAIAMDIARARHMDVAKAGELVGKVAGGNTGILARYGIVIEKGASATEALAELQGKFAGQAEAYGKTTAGAVDRAEVALENLGETIGAKAAPLVADLAGKFSELIRQYTLGEGPGGRIRDVVEGVGSAAHDAAGGVRSLVVGFQQGQGTIRAVTATVTGLASGFAAFKVGGTVVAGLGAVKKGLEAVKAVDLATSRTMLGAIGLAASALVGFLATLSIKTREATTSTEEFTRALREQEEAMRAVADIELDVAQRRANLRSATLGVERAEKAATEARKEHGKKSLEAREAEANLRQARIGQRRAAVDLARAEEDATETRRRGREATQNAREEERKLNGNINRNIEDREKEIRGIDNSIEAVKQQGGNYEVMMTTVDRLRTRQRKLRDEINALKSKKVTVDLDFKLMPAPGSSFGSQVGDGIGAAVRSSVSRVAQQGISSGALMPMGQANLMGADSDLGGFAALAAGQGLSVTSGLRPGSVTSSGNQSYHATGDAIDVSGSSGGMMNFFRGMKSTFGSRLRELIYTPGGAGIKDGRPFQFSGQVARDHYDHVHVAYTGPFGDGIGQAAAAARAAGFRGQDLITAVAIAGAESGYRNNARLSSGVEDSRGMWQINTMAHPWASNLGDANANAKAAYRVFRQAGGFGPWSVFTSGKYRSYLQRARAAVSGGGGSRAGGGGGGGGGGGPAKFGPNAPVGLQGALANVEVSKAKAQVRDNLPMYVAALQAERAIKRRQLKRIRKRLAGRMTRAARNAAKATEAQLISEIGDLSKDIREFGADMVLGGAKTITQAEGMEAGVSPPPDEPPPPPAPEGNDNSAAIAELTAAIDRQTRFNEWMIRTQGPTIVGAVLAAVNGGIGGPVGLGFQGVRSVPGSVAGF